MSDMSITHRRSNPESSPSIGTQVVYALGLGGVLFAMILAVILTGFNFYHAGRIYPGVWMSGINLSGLTPEEAVARLEGRLSYPQTGKIVFRSGSDVWIARPADLGLAVDVRSSAEAAYRFGRQGNTFQRMIEKLDALYAGQGLSPLLVYDERQARAFLGGIAAQINRPTVEAALDIQGTNVSAKPGQVGRQVDLPATLQPLAAQLSSLTDGLVELVVVETSPEILDANQAAEQARAILSAPLVIEVPDAQPDDPGPWALQPEQLAELLVVEKVDSPEGAQYQIGLRSGPLRRFLEDQSAGLAREPENARFIFNDETAQLEILQPAVIGRSLNLDASLEVIQTQVIQGEHAAQLTLDITAPDVTSDATAEQLGITQLVSSHTSYFRGSSAERIQNIEAAAARFHGLLVPPGAVFSMAEAMGDVSLDTGFAEALIIFGGRTIKGVGGGVCQVSTTLFRTAFLGGFPIVERYPHAYRVGYYEQTAQGWDANYTGLDATVFVPQVDFKFKNNTDSWLLMETYVNAKAGRLTWKFYSTSDGREVTWDTTGPQNIVEPEEPIYEENPELSAGEIKQVDWAADGADVTVTRVVRRGGEVLFSDTFVTHYQPWRDVYQYGPGTDIDRNRD